ncbi:NADP-dependent oxidoreductase [Mesorhizobium sp. CU2]|nr:NADP-dependent oxidoreductase [Mesorhizobium sp. CU3]TPO15908.1 NADP-dependent oxidoreductase [Mesorhizobium sp. CU2]
MIAARVNRFGPPEAIQMEEVDRPVAGPGEVLVRVHAAGVGPWDGWVRGGKSVLPQPLPLTPGADLAGTVESVGADVFAFARGDSVFGATNPRFVGAYAEYAVASAAMIARKPARLGDIEAASIPVIAVTAWQAIFEHAELAADQTVLIHGAAGNVGAFAVQLASRAGANVVAVVAEADTDYVRSLGASHTIDYTKERFEEKLSDVDAVIDLVGGETQRRSLSILKPRGILVSTVSRPNEVEAARHGVRSSFFLVDVSTARLDKIASMLERGDLVGKVGEVLPLASAVEAHEMLEGRRPHRRGKIVLRVAPENDR